MLQKFAGPIVEAPFCGAAPVRPNMLNMPINPPLVLIDIGAMPCVIFSLLSKDYLRQTCSSQALLAVARCHSAHCTGNFQQSEVTPLCLVTAQDTFVSIFLNFSLAQSVKENVFFSGHFCC